MNTQKTLRVGVWTLATMGIAFAAFSAPAQAAERTAPKIVHASNRPMGPGTTSIKTPFNIVEVGDSQAASTRRNVYFHTSNGQSVRVDSKVTMGPGLWSVKAGGIH
jgi:hypothetical protein